MQLWQAVVDLKSSSHIRFSVLRWGCRGCCDVPWPGGARQLCCRGLTCRFEKHLNILCSLVTSRLWCVRVAGCRNLTVNAILYFPCYRLPFRQLNKTRPHREDNTREVRGDEMFQPNLQTEGQIFMVEISFCRIKDGLSVCKTK